MKATKFEDLTQIKELRKDLYIPRFTMGFYKTEKGKIVLYGSINLSLPPFDKISYVVFSETYQDKGPVKTSETSFSKLGDAIKYYNLCTQVI